MASLFRYPGGKSKIKYNIINTLTEILNSYECDNCEYREPFFGGGSIGINLIKSYPKIRNIWINDIDYGISSIWNSVISFPDDIIQLCYEFKPSVKMFDLFKNKLLDTESIKKYTIAEIGFMKLALHQMSYSGLGTKSGGPIGGRNQSSNYGIGCRWNADSISRKIKKISNIFFSVDIRYGECSSWDFEKMFLKDSNYIMYLDPPYYKKGGQLYQYSFDKKDHIKLSNILKEEKCPWVLSYDDCDEITELYKWAYIIRIPINYTINTSRDNNELIVVPSRYENLFKKVEFTIFD